jgi:SHS2 domain-containing protein
MKPYEIIEHTADVGLKANGSTLKELFENAAKGMFEIIGGKSYAGPGPAKIEKNIQIRKQVEGLEELLVDWLSELLYVFNKERTLFRDFKILELNNNGLTGKSSGEKIDPAHANLKTEIKAVTFHDLKIEEDETGFTCKIIFDV